MKAETEIVLGIRSVGDKSKDFIIESMTVVEALKRIAQYSFESTMAQRFQFTFARSREDALIGLGLKTTLKDARRTERAKELTSFVDTLFAAKQGVSVSDSNNPDSTTHAHTQESE